MRQKNALRGHYIGDFDPAHPTQEPSEWVELAKWVTEVSDDTDETTTDEAYYDGDGTTETTVTGVKIAYTFDGTYDAEDKAQAKIANMKTKTGDGRKLWHKVVDSNKKKQWVGVATATEIIAGSGAAGDYEKFGCKLGYNSIPKETPYVEVGS